MADSALQILIETLASTAGAEAVSKALAELKAQVDEQKNQIDELTDANEKLNAKLEHGAKHVEHLHLNHRALHKIMHLIGHETAPELGHALAASMMGSLGLVLGLGMGFGFLHKKLEKAHERALELANVRFESMHAALEQSVKIMDEFVKKSIDQRTEIDKLNQKFNEQLTTLKAILAAKEKIEGKPAAASLHQDLQAEISQIETLVSQIDQLDKQVNKDLPKQLEEMRKELLAYQTSPDYIANKTEAVDYESDEGKKGKKARRKALLAIEENGGEEAVKNMQEPPPDTSELGTNASIQAYIEAKNALKLVKEYEAFKARQSGFSETANALTSAIAEITKSVETAQAALTNKTNEIQTHKTEVARLFAERLIPEVQAITAKANAGGQLTPAEKELLTTVATMITGKQTNTVNAERMFTAAGAEELIKKAQELSNRFSHGGKITLEEMNFITQLANKLFRRPDQQLLDFSAAERMFEGTINKKPIMENLIGRLVSVMEKMDSGIARRLESRVSDLEKQVQRKGQ